MSVGERDSFLEMVFTNHWQTGSHCFVVLSLCVCVCACLFVCVCMFVRGSVCYDVNIKTRAYLIREGSHLPSTSPMPQTGTGAIIITVSLVLTILVCNLDHGCRYLDPQLHLMTLSMLSFFGFVRRIFI